MKQITEERLAPIMEETTDFLNKVARQAAKLRQSYAALLRVEVPDAGTEDAEAFQQALGAIKRFEADCRALRIVRKVTTEPETSNECLDRLANYANNLEQQLRSMRSPILQERREIVRKAAEQAAQKETRRRQLIALKRELEGVA